MEQEMIHINDRQLPKIYQESSVSGTEVTLYRGNQLDQITFAHGVKRIKEAFPDLSPGWFDILKQRCKEKNFTNEQFRDAVNNLIDTCVYPKPTIANVLSWDKRIETLSKDELMRKYPEIYIPSGGGYMKMKGPDPLNDDYAPVRLNGQIRYVKKEYQEYFEQAESTDNS